MSIMDFWSTDRVFKHIRNPDTPRWLLVSARKLWLETLNRFMDSPRKKSLNDYMVDPLLSFQVNPQILRSSTLLEMFLTCLKGVLKSSKSYYTLTLLTEFKIRLRKDQNQNDLNDCEKIKDNIL